MKKFHDVFVIPQLLFVQVIRLDNVEKELMNTKTSLMSMIQACSIPQRIFETLIKEGVIGMDASSKND